MKQYSRTILDDIIPTHISVHKTQVVPVSVEDKPKWRVYNIANRRCVSIEVSIQETGRTFLLGFDEQEVQKGNYLTLISQAAATAGQNRPFKTKANPQELWYCNPFGSGGAMQFVFTEYYVREDEYQAYLKERK